MVLFIRALQTRNNPHVQLENGNTTYISTCEISFRPEEEKNYWCIQWCKQMSKCTKEGASEMAEWPKVLGQEPDDQSSIPRTHINVEKEKWFPKIVPWPPHMCYGNCANIHISYMITIKLFQNICNIKKQDSKECILHDFFQLRFWNRQRACLWWCIPCDLLRHGLHW